MSQLTAFSQWLRQQRKTQGITQRDLARHAGCAEVTLRKVEAGDLHPSPQLVACLARCLGVADADLPDILAFARSAGVQPAPALRSPKPRHPHNLPTQLTPLLGREQDISAVRGRLLDGARLITLLGPPGVGKTRLALAVAESVLEQFEHGAFFVRLGPVNDRGLVTLAVVQALGFQMSGPNPPAVQLRAYLEEKHLLLVLDNFEHVIEAAPLVDDLLRRCPWLHVLVTCRQPLRLRGERQAPVLPLALPAVLPGAIRVTAGEALYYPAVALFEDRAQAVQPDFAVSDANAADVIELCRRLDGLPLAIELVASRVKLLPPAELLAHLSGPWMLSVDGLRDVSVRQRTLRGAMAWSYDLLSPAQQALFTRLAVFVGGCTLEAAEAVCGGGETSGQGDKEASRQGDKETSRQGDKGAMTPSKDLGTAVLDGIATLLDKSLLRRGNSPHGTPRYFMLDTVREYALEQLESRGEEALARQRHLAHYAHMLRRADQELYGVQRLAWYHWFDGEVYNLRAALATALDVDGEAALWIASTFADYLIIRGRFDEARQGLDQALALPAVAAHTEARAWALVQLLRLDFYQPQRAQVWPGHEEALAVSRQLDFTRGTGEALFWLGWIALNEGDRTQAEVDITEALRIFRASNNQRRTVLSLCILGEIAAELGDLLRAQGLVEESLVAAQQAGLKHSTDRPLGDLADLARMAGDLGRARGLIEQALAVSRELGFQTHIAWQLLILGQVSAGQGDRATAHAALDEALALFSQWQEVWGLGAVCFELADLAEAEGQHDQALQLYHDALPMLRLRRCLAMQPLLLQRLAAIELYQGKTGLAAQLLGCAEAVQEAVALPIIPIELARWDSTVVELRDRLDAPILAAEWAAGRAMSFEQAVAQVL
ncbi:MAG: helix-turn-helix domain-containing protein [Anaerolineae bacterium]